MDAPRRAPPRRRRCERPPRGRSAPTQRGLPRPQHRRSPCRSRAPRRAGSPAPPTRAARRRRSRRSIRTNRAARDSRRAAADCRAGRTPSACPLRAVPRYLRPRGRPTRSPRPGGRFLRGGLLRGRLRRRRLLRGRLLSTRRLRRGLRRRARGPLLRSAVRGGRGRAGEDAIEPVGRGFLVHLLRVHQLGGEDLLRLDEHLLLTGGQALLAVAEREVPHDLGELEDVAGLHLVAVVLEATVPVLRHLRAAAGEGLHDDLDHVFADHLPEAYLLGVLRRHVHGHVVVQDLDREVLTLLAEDLALFLLHDRPSPVVWIHHPPGPGGPGRPPKTGGARGKTQYPRGGGGPKRRPPPRPAPPTRTRSE